MNKLNDHPVIDQYDTCYGTTAPNNFELMDKVNELIDEVHELKNDIRLIKDRFKIYSRIDECYEED